MRGEKIVKKIPYSNVRLLEAVLFLVYAVLSYIYLKDDAQNVIGVGSIAIMVIFELILVPYPQRTVFQKCNKHWKTLFWIVISALVVSLYFSIAPVCFAAYYLYIFIMAKRHHLDAYSSKEELKEKYADVML